MNMISINAEVILWGEYMFFILGKSRQKKYKTIIAGERVALALESVSQGAEVTNRL